MKLFTNPKPLKSNLIKSPNNKKPEELKTLNTDKKEPTNPEFKVLLLLKTLKNNNEKYNKHPFNSSNKKTYKLIDLYIYI